MKLFEILEFQFGTSSWGGTRSIPYAFTEQGVLMLSGIKRKLQNQDQNIELVFSYLDELISKQENQLPRKRIGYILNDKRRARDLEVTHCDLQIR